jgi:hypothetical protein
VAEEKKVPKWVRTGNPADANPRKENPDAEAETPQEQAEIIPPPVPEDVRQENERQNIPWTPDGVSVEEHRKQIEATAAKPMPLSEGNAPPDRSIVTPADPPVPAPLDPQAEQALRLQQIWASAQALNPEGRPISGVQLSDSTLETEVKGGVEVTTLRLGQSYVPGPDANEQPHGMASHSSERPAIPCPHCEKTGEVPFGWVHKENGDAA